MFYLALSASFEYLSYGSEAIINICLSFSDEIVFRRQNLMSIGSRGPITERAKPTHSLDSVTFKLKQKKCKRLNVSANKFYKLEFSY